MPKTHLQIIEAVEAQLLYAMTTSNKLILCELIHRDFVYTNENGEVFIGIEKLQINEPKILSIATVEIEERIISFFNNIAVVNSFEKRSGTFHGMQFDRQYRVTRIWKFHNKKWRLIVATVVLP